MAQYNYAFDKYNKETMSRSCGRNLKISMKKAVELCREIQGQNVNKAISTLQAVIEQKHVIPYRRYRAEMGHKRGIGVDTGGFPVNVAKAVLGLVELAKKAAEEKELGDSLYVVSASARQGTGRFHIGRYMGRDMKATNVEVVLVAKEKKATKKAAKAEVKKE